MEIKTEDYSIVYNAETATVVCKGSLLLSGTEEYSPISDLFSAAAEQEPTQLVLDLCELEFLNSSGINTMTKFVISVRNKSKPKLIVVGHEQIPWQVRLLKNLQRLMPSLTMQLK